MSHFTIGNIEDKLLELFPAYEAEDWDMTGLSVGDRNASAKKIAIALDPTIKAIEQAKADGCNLLITHHPPFFGSANSFFPESLIANSSGQLVYSSIKNDVALMNFHTALDASDEGRAILPSMLGLKSKHIVHPSDDFPPEKSKYGFGMLNVLNDEDKGITLEEFAKKCKNVFGRNVIAWGDPSTKLNTIATTTGSTGSSEFGGLLSNCAKLKVDCLVCGETKYHYALALKDSGVCIVELGHDVSEIPLTNCLRDALIKIGYDKNDIVMIDQSDNWF